MFALAKSQTMKNSIILWISAAIITFLIGFIQNRTATTYPTSGIIGIQSQKVSYHFIKIHRDSSNYSILIRSDLNDLSGILLWRHINGNEVWNSDTLKLIGESLSASIPKQEPQSYIEYRVILVHKGKEYYLPNNRNEKILFLGRVPTSIVIHYYLTLFFGLLLAIRSGLEFFNHKPRLKLHSIFAAISFFACAMIFAPVFKAYELGAIGKYVPPLKSLFDPVLVSFVVIWITAIVLISYIKYPKRWILGCSTLTIIIFIAQNFF
jgi:hypothetical protein